MALAFQPQTFDNNFDDTFDDNFDYRAYDRLGAVSSPGNPFDRVAIPAPIFEHPAVTQARVEATYRRRRIIFVIAAVIFSYGLWSLAIGAVNMASAAAPAGTDFSVVSDLPTVPFEPAPTYTVESGDTLWSIAQGLGAGGDLRVVVDQIISLNDGVTVLKPGQRLVLPYYGTD